MIRSTTILAAAALLVTGCASGSGGDYPSLAPRATEKLGFGEPDAPAPNPIAADPALDASLAAIATRLAAVTEGFTGDATKAEAAARRAKGQPVGSDPWLDAQSALAGLDDWRAQASAVMTDLDALASDRAAALTAEYPGLTELRGRAQSEVDRQAQMISRLQTSLPAA